VHLTTFAKAKVEACVLIVERWLIGRLRNRVFHSLAELNAANSVEHFFMESWIVPYGPATTGA
jgi:hypothetical protein